MSLNDINSLSHTKWNCKYHIVFAPKYRRKVFYKEKCAARKILRQLCETIASIGPFAGGKVTIPA